MKKILLAFAFLVMGLTSCEEITDAINSVRVPEEAKPSKSFSLGQYSDELNTDKACRFETSQSDSPFSSIEFFADGHYIITNGKATRATEADVYGTYSVGCDPHYTLENGDEIDATSLNGTHGTITYTPKGGDPISIKVVSASPLVSEASKCISRTWTLEHSKYWLSVKGLMALHRDYYMENGTLAHKDNKVAGFIGEFYQGDLITLDRWPETITISPFGTYFVRFASGKTLLQEWSWADEAKGKIKTASNAEFNITDFLKNHNVTLRFDIYNKLILYTDYELSGTRIDNANTFVPSAS